MADMSRPVAVGIDGSTAAIRAMLWAVDEAVIRNLALRLVHVLPTRGPDNCGETSFLGRLLPRHGRRSHTQPAHSVAEFVVRV